MTRYSVQPRDRIFAKGYGFLYFTRNIDKSVGKNISKNSVVNIVKKFLIRLNNLLKMRFKKSDSKNSWRS